MPDYHGYDKMTDAQLLQKVRKGWKCVETPCGTGSMLENTVAIREHLPRIAERYGITSVADAGAGDLHWIPRVEWHVDYLPFDLYPRHADVQQLDITKELLPKADMILCRHVLNHLSIQYSERAISNFRLSGAKYLLMTNSNNQSRYWTEYGFSVGEPMERFTDCQSWWLELYGL